MTRKTARAPLLPTIDPNLTGCRLQEPWDIQQLRCRNVKNTNHGVVPAVPAAQAPAADADQMDVVAPINEQGDIVEINYDAINEELQEWAACETCDKWRKIKRGLKIGESYNCADDLTLFIEFAHCDAPLEEGAEDL